MIWLLAFAIFIYVVFCSVADDLQQLG